MVEDILAPVEFFVGQRDINFIISGQSIYSVLKYMIVTSNNKSNYRRR